MSIFERSECFRAFLLLIGADRKITDRERSLLLAIGKKLDFDRRFCEVAIAEILENRYIPQEPPLFSQREFAEDFLVDGLRIARADDELHQQEFAWLTRIAQRNGISQDWLENAKIDQNGNSAVDPSAETLAIERHL